MDGQDNFNPIEVHVSMDRQPRYNSIEICVSMDRRKGRIGKTIPAKLRKGVVLGVLCGIILPVV